jgi:hypothetical protein
MTVPTNSALAEMAAYRAERDELQCQLTAANERIAELENALAADAESEWFRRGHDAGRAAERAAIVAEAVGTANSIVLGGVHSVDYWTGFRDALECFARNIAGAHLPSATEGEQS